MSTESHRWHYDYTRILWDAGFCFNNQKCLKTYDRNGIDIDRIIRDRDIGIVDHHIQNVLEYSLDTEEARILDPNFVKLFRLSQLAVEYLNFCKKYLDATTDTLKKELQKSNEENDDLKSDIVNYELEINKLKKKVKDLKSTLHIHQKYPIGIPYAPVGTFRCNECKKGFLNAEYLKKHVLKRHPDSTELQHLENPEDDSEINSSVHPQYKAETDKLQMEIKELKEKLNSTERFFQNKTETVPSTEDKDDKESKKHSEEYYKHVEELHHQFELLKTQIESEMQVLKTQKVEQDKYEEIMEKFFHKLDERKEHDEETLKEPIQQKDQIEDQINEASTSKTVQNIVASATFETDKEICNDIEETNKKEQEPEIVEKEEIVKPEEIKVQKNIPEPEIVEKVEIVKPEEIKVQKNIPEPTVEREPVDVEKLKQEMEKELEEKTKQNIEKLGMQISENIASTFDVLQGRLEIFWNKLQEIEVDKQQQRSILTVSPKKPLQTEIVRETPQPKQRILITRPPQKIQITSVKKQEKTIVPEKETIKPDEVTVVHELSSDPDDDSNTESSKNEILAEIYKPQSVLKSVQKSDKIARNLMAELKTKVEERNFVAEAKKLIVEKEKPTVQKIYSKSSNVEKRSFVAEPKKLIVEKEKSTVQQIYSKSSKVEVSSEESETESETESESESETETPVVVKPSKTTTASSKSQRPTTVGTKSSNTGISTLQNRSITSLENALRMNPEILTQLREDMKDIVASRLKDLGVDPEWTKLPEKTYKQNIEIVTHHRALAAKNVKYFMDIRNDILENLEEQVGDLKRRESRDVTTPEPEQKPSRFKSLLQNMRNKAKSIMKPERAPTPNTPIYKLTMERHQSSPEIHKAPEKPKEIIKSKSISPKSLKPKHPAGKSKMYDTESDDSELEQIPTAEKIISTRKKLNKSKSESSLEVAEFSDQETEYKQVNQKTTSANNLARSLDSILEMKKELAHQLKNSIEKVYSVSSLDTIDNVKDETIAVSPRVPEQKNTNIIHKIETEKNKLNISSSDIESDEFKDDEKTQKSVLKNIASTSAVKKKVLFDLHSDPKTETEEQNVVETKTPIKKTIVKPNSMFKTNDWNASSSSIDSSYLENKKEKGSNQPVKGKSDTISTKAVINVSTKQNKAQDDISDWEISDIN